MSQTKIQADNSTPIHRVAPKTAVPDGALFDRIMPSPGLLDSRANLPGSLSIRQNNMLALQRQVGNQAVLGLMVQRDAEGEKRRKFQKNVSTPLPKGAKIAGKKATLSVGGANVTILPDTETTKKKMTGKASTSSGIKGWSFPEAKTKDGKIASFVAEKPPEVEIQTTYGPEADPSGKSTYGRGTTEEDKKAKNTSLRFHEGMHGQATLDYLGSNPIPKCDVKVGMTEAEWDAALDDYEKKMQDYSDALHENSKVVVDCVGKEAKFCSEEGGEHEH